MDLKLNAKPVFGRLAVVDGRAEFTPIGHIDGDETWLTVKEAAAMSRSWGWVGPRTIYEWGKGGMLRTRRATRNTGMEVALSSLEKLFHGRLNGVREDGE